MFREIGVSIADYREKLQHTPYRTTCPSSCAPYRPPQVTPEKNFAIGEQRTCPSVNWCISGDKT